MSALQTDIEDRLATAEPEVEVLAVEQIAAERLRLVIDRPGGVDLALCERVTHHLRELLVDWGLEVSSPGPQRPLTKPDHFRRFVGRLARVKTQRPLDGHRSFTGELIDAGEEAVTIAAGPGLVRVPYEAIAKGNLVEAGKLTSRDTKRGS